MVRLFQRIKLQFKIIKFAFVGILNNLSNFGLVIFLNKVTNANAFLAGAMGYLVGATISLILNSKYTFGYKKINPEIIIYFFISQISLLFAFSSIIYCLNYFLDSIELAWFLSVIIIFLINYFIQSYFIFKKK